MLCCAQACGAVASSYAGTYRPQLRRAVATVDAQAHLAEALFGPAASVGTSGAFPAVLSAEPDAVASLLAAVPGVLPLATGQVEVGVPVPHAV